MVFFFIDNINIAIGPNFVLIGQFVAIILPLHLFSIFCMFHTFYFVAKTIRTVEFQQPVKFGDFAGELFLIWFFPIGIWILQPRINKILESSNIE